MSDEEEDAPSPKKDVTPNEMLRSITAPIQSESANEAQGLVTVDYELIRVIGRGISSAVYQARNRATGETVAVKQINKQRFQWNRKQLLRFSSEVEIMRTLKHPNLISLIKCYESSKQLSIVMEFAWGGTLKQYMESHELTPAEAKIVVSQLVTVLAHLHNNNCVHRDVKADNVLLKSARNVFCVKLADLGVSVITSSSLHSFVGTSGYFAPEMLSTLATGSVRYDKAVDSWSLGVLTFCMLTGRMPFEGKSNEELLECIRNTNLQFPPHVDRQAIDFVCKLLSVRVETRMSMEEASTHPWLASVSQDPRVAVAALPGQSYMAPTTCFALKGRHVKSLTINPALLRDHYAQQMIRSRSPETHRTMNGDPSRRTRAPSPDGWTARSPDMAHTSRRRATQFYPT